MRHTAMLLSVIGSVLGFAAARLNATAACPQGRAFTSDNDFDDLSASAVKHNVDHPTSGQLQLVNTLPALRPFLNVAATDAGTVVRIDVSTAQVVGEYRTAPDGRLKSPSRTTVDRRGNCWVANREENTVSSGGCSPALPSTQRGSITRIALIEGGEHVIINGKHYIVDTTANPITYCSVGTGENGDWHALDRPEPGFPNGDGRIRTSSGIDGGLDWANPNEHDTNGCWNSSDPDTACTAEDELIVNYTRITATGARTLAVDGNGDLWVGGSGWTGVNHDMAGNHEPGRSMVKPDCVLVPPSSTSGVAATEASSITSACSGPLSTMQDL